MKTHKQTILAAFFTLLIIAVSIANLMHCELISNHTKSLIDPVPAGLFYSMQLPFTQGAMLTDRVEQAIINQYSESSKTLHQFNFSYIREIRNFRKSVQYISELNLANFRKYSFYNCVLRI